MNETLKIRLRRCRAALSQCRMRVLEKSVFAARLHYLFFDRSYDGEIRAVSAGISEYHKQLHANAAFFVLRRNTHKLEKGLIMRPMRPVFALDYIGETVACYKALASDTCACAARPDEFAWFTNVLKRYFDAVQSHPVIDPLRAEFAVVYEKTQHRDGMTPYKRDLSATALPTYDAMLALAQRRRSVRWYLDKPVPRDLIDKAVEVAKLAPSGCNRQPFRFHVIDDKNTIADAAALPGGTLGWAQNIPVFVVVTGTLEPYCYERDRHSMYIDASLAAMGLLFALETEGLSSCVINWVDLPEKERKMAQILGLKPCERPLMCVAVGYPDPDGLVPYSQKLPMDEIRQYH